MLNTIQQTTKKMKSLKMVVKYYLTAKALKDGSKETGDVVEGTTEVTYVYEKAGQVASLPNRRRNSISRC